MIVEDFVKKTTKKIMNEAKFKTVKVIYANGLSIETSVNPNLTDQEIKNYYKIGSTVNIGMGENDKITKIKSVEIAPDLAEF